MLTTTRAAYGYTLRAAYDQDAVVVHAQFDAPVDRVVLTAGGFPSDLAPSEYVVTATSPRLTASDMNWSYSAGLKSCFRYLPAANSHGVSSVPGLSVTQPAREFTFTIAGRVSPRAPVTDFLRTVSVTAPALPRLDARLVFLPKELTGGGAA